MTQEKLLPVRELCLQSEGRIFIRPLDYTIDSIKIHLLSLQHCFFFLLFRNLLMNVGIIQPVQICILTNLIIKWNYH